MTSLVPEFKHIWSENFAASLNREPLTYSTVHTHNFFEIEFAISGSVMHLINNEVTIFRGGDIWFLPPPTVHHFYGAAHHMGVDRYLLFFDPTFISNTVWRQIDVHALPLCIHLEGDELYTLQNIFQSLLPYTDKRLLPRNSYIKWTLEWIILHLFEKHLPSETAPVLSQLQPALIYIQTHFRESISIEDVADIVHFSSEHFSRLFHKNIGMSYQNYVLNLRLTHSYSMLFSPDTTVSEVCFQSGFNSPEYFSRAFKKKFGISPLQHHLDKNPEKQRKSP